MCNRALLLFGKMLQWNLHVNCHVNRTTFQSSLSWLWVSCKRAQSLREVYFLCIVPYVFCLFVCLFVFFFAFLCWIKLCSCCFRQVFFHLEVKKVVAGRVRQAVVLYSNDWMGICLGRLSIGRFSEVVVWTGLIVML